MALLFGALVLGFLLARSQVYGEQLKKKVGIIGQGALLVLLFSMGLSLGANPELTKALPSLGLKALILSLGAIFGSVLLVWLVTRRAAR